MYLAQRSARLLQDVHCRQAGEETLGPVPYELDRNLLIAATVAGIGHEAFAELGVKDLLPFDVGHCWWGGRGRWAPGADGRGLASRAIPQAGPRALSFTGATAERSQQMIGDLR